MVMYLPPRSSSAGMRSIRRELQRRRSKPLAPTRSVAKKPSASPPPTRQGSTHAVRDPRHCPPHQEIPPSTISHSRGSTVTDASPQSRARASSRCIVDSPPPPPPRRSVPSSTGSANRATLGVATLLRPGTVVGVRTRTTTLKTGQVLVLWLKATVVSSTHAGYEVVYDGNPPSGDPKGTVRVARHHVRVIKTSPSPTTPPPSLPPRIATVAAAQKKDTLPAARPTTAGKSVRLIRSLLPEMERQARAPLSGIGY
ncbi:unnamed protein product [Miscanthus lutarioriparius]|uniref:Uncharacterized protein n=1 Tax=Miscanthus lutarioriparius TaxID=422564 RepID=A0A811N9V8_9POAL|nr:unnamed protein product [Miscanthus lutarioriparius]